MSTGQMSVFAKKGDREVYNEKYDVEKDDEDMVFLGEQVPIEKTKI